MRKRVGIIKRLFTLLLVFLISINSFAAIVSDNDGSAFITKSEFDALKSSFQSQIDSYNNSIDSKIDGAIASYLAGIRLSTTMVLENQYKNNGGNTLKWEIIDPYVALGNSGSWTWTTAQKRPFFFCRWYSMSSRGSSYSYSTEVTGSGASARGSNYWVENDMIYNLVWDCGYNGSKKELRQISKSGIRLTCNLNSAYVNADAFTASGLFKLNSDGTSIADPTLTGATFGVGDYNVQGYQTFVLYRKNTKDMSKSNMVKLLFNGAGKDFNGDTIRAHDVTKDGVATNGSSTNTLISGTSHKGYSIYELTDSITAKDLYSVGQVGLDEFGKVGYGRWLTTPSNDGVMTFEIQRTAGTYSYWKFAIYDEDNVTQSLGAVEDGLEFTYDGGSTKVKNKVFTNSTKHKITLNVEKNKKIFIKLYPCTDSSGTFTTTNGHYVTCAVDGDIVLTVES